MALPTAEADVLARAMSGVSAKAAKAMILALPGVEEGVSYGQPSFKLRGKFFTRLRDQETVLVLLMPIDERDVWMEIAPETYFVTDHYRGYPSVLVRLAAIEADALRARLEQSWRARATKAAVKAYDAAQSAARSG